MVFKETGVLGSGGANLPGDLDRAAANLDVVEAPDQAKEVSDSGDVDRVKHD